MAVDFDTGTVVVFELRQKYGRKADGHPGAERHD